MPFAKGKLAEFWILNAIKILYDFFLIWKSATHILNCEFAGFDRL